MKSTAVKPEPLYNNFKKSCQRYTKGGRIKVGVRGIIIRIIALAALTYIAANNIRYGIIYDDFLVIYGTLMLMHAVTIMSGSWFLYKNPARGAAPAGNELVSIIIPIYNQATVIRFVIETIFRSTYRNIEVFAVNDGSTDGTKEILDSLQPHYPRLNIIHKNNQGKRRAVADGFYRSHGEYIVVIDSDSVIVPQAIEESIKTFHSNPDVGAVAGHCKIWNHSRNFITKFQDAWYDYAYNLRRAAESAFGSVLCCPGTFGAYRREAICDYIPYWADSKIQFSDDRMLTSYAMAPPDAKQRFLPHLRSGSSSRSSFLQIPILSQSTSMDIKAQTSKHALGNGSLKEWKVVYVSSAIHYCETPESLRIWMKQLLRWKKGTVRTNTLYVSAFFAKKSVSVFMKILFYTDLMAMFTSPFVIMLITFYYPFILHDYLPTAYFFIGFLIAGFVYGLDYRLRDRNAKYWGYSILIFLAQFFVFTWLLFPAIMRINNNEWLTR
jgi:hyaluronan synthase